MRYPPLLQTYFDCGYGREPYRDLVRDRWLQSRLQPPTGTVDAVVDTDAYNEIDDQYALAWLLCAPDRVRIQAITAAPFHNIKAESPAQGMQRSYREILHVLELLGCPQRKKDVYLGAESFLPDEKTPVLSPGAQKIIDLAERRLPEDPLYVVAIGAITNVASALLCRPAIRDNIVVLWLGGHSRHWPNTREFNLVQDIAAARAVFASKVPLVQFPCAGVCEQLAVTGPELEAALRGQNAFCNYLCDLTAKEAALYCQGPQWNRIIWDIAPVSWLMGKDMVDTQILPAWPPSYSGYYEVRPAGHSMDCAYAVHREKIFSDLFARLSGRRLP